MRALGTFLQLDWKMKVHIVESLLLPRAIWMGFKTIGVARTQGLLRSWGDRRRHPGRQNAEPDMAVIERARRAQRIVQRATGIGGTCLVRSFVLWAVLRKRGIETDIRVGMRKNEGRAEGHAWLEYLGQPLNETDSVIATYSVLPVPATYDLWLQGSKQRSFIWR